MGGFAFYGPYDNDSPIVEETLFQISTNPRYTAEVPKYATLLYIMKHFPNILTDVTEESILDRTESGGLSKALLIVQVGWFCTSCVARLSQNLPLCLLEISTAAHAICSLITYFVWWSKPINVAEPTLMREKKAQEVYALLKCSHDEYNEALEMAKICAAGRFSALTGLHKSAKIVLAANALQHLLPSPERPPLRSSFRKAGGVLVPGNFANKSPGKGKISVSRAAAISPIIYGVIHTLAWSHQFPTPSEEMLWRVSSIIVTCSGVIIVVLIWSINSMTDLFALYLMPIIHMIASGFLIGESFRQLLFLDSTAYQVPSWSWPNYWPHLS